jgi:hypothetical protein
VHCLCVPEINDKDLAVPKELLHLQPCIWAYFFYYFGWSKTGLLHQLRMMGDDTRGAAVGTICKGKN